MPIKYLKLQICDGCAQCKQQQPNGSFIIHEHVIGQSDVTSQVTESLHLKRIDAVIGDIVVKEFKNV